MEEKLNEVTNELKLIKVSELCRTCLSREDVTNNIDESELMFGKYVKLTDMLDKFRDIKTSDKDNLPPKICLKCLGQLKSAFSFWNISIRSQNVLTSIINKSEKSNTVQENNSSDKLSINKSTSDSQSANNTKRNIQKNSATGTQRSSDNVCKLSDNLIVKGFNIPQHNKVQNVVKLLPANFVRIPNKQGVFVLNGNMLTQGVIINNGPQINNIVKSDTRSEQEVRGNQAATQQTPVLYNILQNNQNQPKPIVPKTKNKKSNSNVTKPIKQFTYKCSKCLRSFKTKELFMTHLNTMHVDKINIPLTKTCSLCNISFDSANELKEHNMSLHFTCLSRANKTRGKVVCSICKKDCNNHYQLKQHLKTVHKANYYSTVCKKCDRYFSSISSLKTHAIKCKAIGESIPCDICTDTSFTSIELYSEHNVEKHQLHICIFCTKGFLRDDDLASHVTKSHDSKKVFQCVYCPLNFLNRWVLIKHLKVKHNISPGQMVCGMCDNNTSYAANKDLLQHLQHECSNTTQEQTNQNASQSNNVNHLNEPVNNCKQIFYNKSNNENNSMVISVQQNSKLQSGNNNIVMVMEGIKQSPGKKDLNTKEIQIPQTTADESHINVTCKICSQAFSSKYDYKKHMTVLHGIRYKKRSIASSVKSDRLMIGKKIEGQSMKRDTEGAYLCEICSKRFLRLVNLEKHFSRHMMSSLQCVRCGYNAENALQMEEHLKVCRSAQAAEKLICPTCGKKLTTAAGLKYHIQAHTGVRKFACPSCGRRFLTCTNMRKHIRIVHSGVRPHLCTLCGRRFPSTDHLAKHVRHTHHNKREYVCKECNKKFLQRCHLAQHMWVHTGIKPYSCPHCPNTYSAVCSLTKHLRRNHWELENQKHIDEEKFYENLENEDQYLPSDGNHTTNLNENGEASNNQQQKGDKNTVIEIIEYEKPQTYFYNTKKIIKYSKGFSTLDSETQYENSLNRDTKQQSDEMVESFNGKCYILNDDGQGDDVTYCIEAIQEQEVEIKEEYEGDEEGNIEVSQDDKEVVDNDDDDESVNISNENDIVIDGICADVLGEEINVVIVSEDDIMVNGSEYGGQIMW